MTDPTVRKAGRYRRAIEILVESAVLYSVALIVLLPFLVQKSSFNNGYPHAFVAQLTGICPTLMVARVSFGHARPDETWQGQRTSVVFTQSVRLQPTHANSSSLVAMDSSTAMGESESGVPTILKNKEESRTKSKQPGRARPRPAIPMETLSAGSRPVQSTAPSIHSFPVGSIFRLWARNWFVTSRWVLFVMRTLYDNRGGANIPRLDPVALAGKGIELALSTVLSDNELQPRKSIFFKVHADEENAGESAKPIDSELQSRGIFFISPNHAVDGDDCSNIAVDKLVAVDGQAGCL
ncbi:hypothetical protein C8J57DRAFT_1255497 [Mycena rebaudengoi]|nr:hypothetical protein C8J57DRAFT_1255497 [Mycena rebaudengoi]